MFIAFTAIIVALNQFLSFFPIIVFRVPCDVFYYQLKGLNFFSLMRNITHLSSLFTLQKFKLSSSIALICIFFALVEWPPSILLSYLSVLSKIVPVSVLIVLLLKFLPSAVLSAIFVAVRKP
jgi:hypothetical protein